MTASSLVQRMTRGLALAAVAALLCVAPARAEEPVKGEVKVTNEDGHARLAFRF